MRGGARSVTSLDYSDGYEVVLLLCSPNRDNGYKVVCGGVGL